MGNNYVFKGFLVQKLPRPDLNHIYWIGGSPCCGKSSIAQALIQAHGLRSYSCDEAYYRHAQIINPRDQPVFSKVSGLSWEQIWLRPVEELLEDEIAVYREEFPLILSDLHALPQTPDVLAEGAALIPEQVAPLVSDPRRAIWVVPSAEFQREQYARRDWAKKIVGETSDPPRAFANWMERDIRFASWAAEQAHSLGMRVLVVDGKHTLAENLALVEAHFFL